MTLEADPYRTLGLSRGATLDEVKRAYRRLAKVNHPDAGGPGALPRFLAIQAAYEQIAGSSAVSGAAGRAPGAATPRRRPSAADQDGTDATRRAYGGRSREPGRSAGPTDANDGAPPGAGPGKQDRGPADRNDGPAEQDSSGTSTRAKRGKATLGSTSYDGADGAPFEPDWGGASWYGTTSGTYWTINPKEYADPRKHGPEYQARARRAASPRASGAPAVPADPTHTTSSWWDSTTGPAGAAEPPRAQARRDEPLTRPRFTDATLDPAPDPARAAADLGRALTDARSGGRRGRVVRAFVGWLPMAFGLGWLVGELTGCGRFAATCDPYAGPLTTVGQAAALVLLLLLPQVASLAAGAALALLVAAVAASLALSATGAAADEGSRRAALVALLLLAWAAGLAISIVGRVRSGPRTPGPVS